MNTVKITCFGIIITFVLYGRLLPFAFTQDDFFLLRQARFNSFSQQLQASLPRSDSIYFRPLGMQGYFFFSWRLLGLHPWAYRFAAIFIHAVNATLVFFLAKRILERSPWIVWLFYLTAPLHFAAIGWIVNISFLLVTCFILLTLLSIFVFRSSWAVTFFISTAALLTNELAISLPLLVLLLSFEEKSNKRMKIWRNMIPIIVATVSYLVFRFSMPRASSGDYAIKLGTGTIQNIRWLSIWTLGWAETVRDYFITIWSIKNEFVHTFPFETLIQAVTTIVLGVILLFGIKKRKFWVAILFFITAIFPVLPFRQHIYPHYAMIGSIGLFLAVAIGLNKLPNIATYCVAALWLLQVAAVMRINLITHWWVQHAMLSESLQRELKTQYPMLPSSKQIYIVSKQPDQARIVFAEDNAVQLLYNNLSAKTVYLSTP